MIHIVKVWLVDACWAGCGINLPHSHKVLERVLGDGDDWPYVDALGSRTHVQRFSTDASYFRNPDAKPEPQPPSRYYKNAHCLEAWPECQSMEYDPRCCRFPKSCSCEEEYYPGAIAKNDGVWWLLFENGWVRLPDEIT